LVKPVPSAALIMADLPILSVLPELLAHLCDRPNAVLVAPPGAGKTTAVAPALLYQPWCSGQILLLSPRRLAARAAAERMAELAGETVGATIGYATRLDSRQSTATRILVVTEGIFRNRIIADPELAGVSAVLFDEVHERSLDSDFALALAIEAQAALRPDLRLLAMSATLDGERFAALLGDCPVVESAGRSHPLTLHHIGRNAALPIEDAMAGAIRQAVTEEEQGDVLAFLPGVREIERTAERLVRMPHAVHRLHGQLDPAQQRAALRPDAEGRRKIILATSIAETSLTIDGVRIVIDSGLARRARFDVAAASSRLVTERASQAAATQRAGRAARQGPGVAYRLWEEAATGGMPRFDPPDILDTDLAPLILDCAAWGERDPARLPWLDTPPAPALTEARARLVRLGAIDDEGAITPHGRAIATLPLPPPLAHMLVEGAAMGSALLAAEIAMLLTERGLGGRDADITRRYGRWTHERGGRADAARHAARRWASGFAALPATDSETRDGRIARLIATAYPDRIARRRNAAGEDWASVGGRGYRLDSESPLAAGEWLAVADVQGTPSGARILSAAPMSEALIGEWIAQHGETRRTARYDAGADRVEAVRETRLGAITLSRASDADGGDPAALLLGAVREGGLTLLPWSEGDRALRARAAFAGLPQLGDAHLSETIDIWLAPVLAGLRRLGAIAPGALHTALLGLLDWDQRQMIEQGAPAEFRTPAGSHHAIDYAAEQGPTVTARVQAFFGLDVHPVIGRPAVPLVLSLTSPAGRAIQTTRDLPGFWRGSWTDVQREMKGRYPRHPWPDAPWEAAATLRTKAADARRSGG
jgi:ATP-dependent helicase HrpB